MGLFSAPMFFLFPPPDPFPLDKKGFFWTDAFLEDCLSVTWVASLEVTLYYATDLVSSSSWLVAWGVVEVDLSPWNLSA